jgi:hypothetical protein
MGFMDKAKFWKKNEAADDFSDLGEFGFDKSLDEPGEFPPLGENISLDDRGGIPVHVEEVRPNQTSRELANQFGIQSSARGTPAQTGVQQQNTDYQDYPEMRQSQQQFNQQPFSQQSQQFSPQQFRPQQAQQQVQQPAFQQPLFQQQGLQQNQDITNIAKEIEIVHAKLDAIRSYLESINQRLASLERIASSDEKTRYKW